MKWVLIVAYGSSAPVTSEWNSRSACVSAGKAIQDKLYLHPTRTRYVCLPKGIKE